MRLRCQNSNHAMVLIIDNEMDCFIERSVVNLLILFYFQVMRIDVTSVTSPVEAARGLIDTAYRVYYTPTNTNHLLVTTENSRLLKFDAPTGKLIAEVRLSLLPNKRKSL